MLKKISRFGTTLNSAEQKKINGGALENRCIRRSVYCDQHGGFKDWLVNREGLYVGCCPRPETPIGPGPGN